MTQRGQKCFPLLTSGYPEHMTLSDFRCHFQALCPPVMKRYASMFVSHDERKVRLRPSAASAPLSAHALIGFSPLPVSQAVEELLTELDVDRRSVVVGASRVRVTQRRAPPPPLCPVEVTCHACFPLCLTGVHEARRAALPGAAEGPAGHRLAGLPAGLLHGTPGPAEVSQTQGETLASMQTTRHCILGTVPFPQRLAPFSLRAWSFVLECSALTSSIELLCLQRPKGEVKLSAKGIHLMLCLLECTAFRTFIHFCLDSCRGGNL